jgi:excisionase family DNA binding protein
MEKQAYSLSEVAEITGVSKSTVIREVERGNLLAVKLSERTRRVSRAELARWWRKNGGGELWEENPLPESPLPEPPHSVMVRWTTEWRAARDSRTAEIMAQGEGDLRVALRTAEEELEWMQPSERARRFRRHVARGRAVEEAVCKAEVRKTPVQ